MTLEINRDRREVRRDGQLVPRLTPNEWDALVRLTEHAGQTVRAARLAPFKDGQSARRAAAVIIRRLRLKVEPAPAEPRYITTVRGVGYRIDDAIFLEGGQG